MTSEEYAKKYSVTVDGQTVSMPLDRWIDIQDNLRSWEEAFSGDRRMMAWDLFHGGNGRYTPKDAVAAVDELFDALKAVP
jgi:hypothetical protein